MHRLAGSASAALLLIGLSACQTSGPSDITGSLGDTAEATPAPADPNVARMLGVIGLIATALYALPRTSVLGAILLTAYMGGAIATNARIGNPLFSHTLFGVYLGVILWGGLYLRDPRVRALIPFSR